MDDLARYQDVFGQMAFLKSYSQLMLCFPVPVGTSRESVIQIIQSASEKLLTAFPWLAAKVVHEGSGPGNSGTFKLASCSLWAPPNTIVVVKDCSNICLPYDEIVEAKGPIAMLDGDLLAPRKAFPLSYQESESDPAPVVAMQANFVKGGLLLEFAAQHNIMDGTGMAQWMQLLAKLMRGEELSSVDIEQGNQDRRNMVSLLGPDEPPQDHSALRYQPPSKALQKPPRPSSTWHYFRFSAAKLAQLKTLAANSQEFVSSVEYITTNDALSAFCWKRIAAVRLRRGSATPEATSKFFRAIDARRALGVSTAYMGHMVYIAVSKLTFKDLTEGSLAATASLMHKDVSDVNTEYHMRSFVTLISNEPDKSTIAYGASFNPNTDVGCSSLAHWKHYDIEFGPLGKPDLFRRPNFMPPIESDIYVMPRTENGDVDALLCVTDADLQGLKSDEQWNSYTEYIG